jgi:formylglycine-generating enzyme required for sulfatase activity
MVEVDEFARRSGAFVDALVALDIPAAHVAPARRLRDDALKAANGAPLFRGIVGHFLQQLRGMGLFPQSHAESPEKTLARLYALADAEPPVMSERPQSRRATHVAEPPMPSRRTATLMQRVERIDRADRADRAEGLERGSQPPARTSSIPPAARPSSAHLRIDEGRAPEPEHRLVVLEEPAESSEPIAIKSNYRVSPRPIGEGGAGKVYAARDVDTGLRVAAKVVTIPDPTRRVLYLGLFQNEREIQGSIDDDAIVRIYKTGLTGRGEPYIVMELLTGGSLADYVDELRHNRRRFHLEEARQIGAMAVSAVAVAHRRGVVHKDVKPDNFLFTEDRRRLKLGDFGIAERKEKLTAGVNGTLGYIPPETYEGKLDTEARDVFALGVTLYELLTGYLPFDDESAAASYYDILGRAPIAPSKRRPDRELGPDLDRIVLRALAAKRDDRYATADDMLFELVSSDVRAMIERARAARDAPADDLDAPDPLARETLWSRTMRDAIRKLEHIAEAFAGDRIRAWRLELVVELHRHADLAGDEPLVRETAEMIAHLAPRHEVVQDAALTVVVDFYFDDPRTLLRRAHAAFTMVELEDRAGVLHTRSTDTSPHFLRTLELPRGRIAALGVRGEGIHPVHVPLPVRPGRHSLRIPLYAADEIPADAVLVPAGRVPARNRHGSLSEASAPEDERRVDHDFAITNLVTQGEWLAFLAWIAETAETDGMEAALARAPSNWRFTRTARERFREADGADLDLAAPVRFVGYDDVRAFLAYLAHAPGRTAAIGARLPTLNEIKRAYRGNDARLFPWGDATARRPSVAAFQYLGFLPAPAPMASVPADPRFADRSPFSSPDGPAVFHLAGNVTELVSIGISAADRALIVGAFPATRGEDPADETLGDRYFVTFGLPYDRPAPTNGDVIGVERWRPGDDPARKPRLAYGFRWVVPLRAVSGV